MNIQLENTHLATFSAFGILEAFLAGTSDAFIVLDNKCQVVTFNDRYNGFHMRLTGNIIIEGTDYRENIIDTRLHFFLSHIQFTFKGNVVKFTESYTNSAGEKFWYDLEFHPLKNDEGEISGIGIGVFDVTDKSLANIKLQENRELFKALVENSADVFQLTDKDLKIGFVSDSIQNVLGYAAADLQDQHFFYLIHADDKMTISSWLHWLIENPEQVRAIEVRVKNSKGNWIYVEINGRNMLGNKSINAIVMNYRDIQAKKTADSALMLTEQRMSLLLNNTKESFIIVNSRLKVVSYNKAAQEHSPFFFSQELQSGLSLVELVGVEELEVMIETFEQIFEGQEITRETFFTDDNEELHVYEHSYRPLYSDDDIVGVFITSTNITEKKKAEMLVRLSEERFKTIIQESFDAMLIVNDVYTVMEASPAIQKILGFSPDEMLNKNSFDLVHPEFIQTVTEKLCEIKGVPNAERSVDMMVLNKNGDYIWVEVKGKNMLDNKLIHGIIILIRDITERKHAEDVISLSEQRFKGLVQSGADMISIIDEEGVVKYSSPTVTTVLGNDPAKDLGRNVFDFMHREEAPAIKEKFNLMLREGTRQLHFGPYRFLNAKREYRWIETVVTNLSDDPAVKGIVINSRDVTETKHLSEEQKTLTNELLKNNKDLQQFSFITSHNLRAPVANLISLLNLYDKENPEEPFNKILIEKFQESTNQLNETLNDLIEVLVLRSNQKIEKEALHLSSFALLMQNNIGNLLAEQNVAFSTDFSQVDEVVYNRVHLESIFLNLVSNAVKYCSPDRTPSIKIHSYKEDGYTVVAFKDNGIGIDLERYKDRIFGLYQRFHAGKEGKGLGLYMIKSQINAMGGKIEVESEPGVGTIFKVYIKN